MIQAVYVLAAAIVLAALILFFGKKRSGQSGETQAGTLGHAIGEVAGRLAETVEGQNKLTAMMTERLDAIEQRVNTTLASASEKTATAISNISTRLETIDKAQANLIELSGQVVSLQDILSDKQTRGAFGQAQMEAIVEDQIPVGHFKFQATLSNNSRPDCVIQIAPKVPSIVIDAKFPLESFEAYKAAKSEAERLAAASKFRSDIKKHVKSIAEKYLIPEETQAPALMFVPAESIYAELHTSFSETIQEARRQQVVIVSPHILMLAVNTLRTLMRDARMRERAVSIQKEVGFLVKDIAELSKGVGKLRQHFDQSNRDIEDLEKVMTKIANRSDKIESAELDASDGPPQLSDKGSTTPPVTS